MTYSLKTTDLWDLRDRNNYVWMSGQGMSEKKKKAELGLQGWVEGLQINNTEVVISGRARSVACGAVLLKGLPWTLHTRTTLGAAESLIQHLKGKALESALETNSLGDTYSNIWGWVICVTGSKGKGAVTHCPLFSLRWTSDWEAWRSGKALWDVAWHRDRKKSEATWLVDTGMEGGAQP